jgi:hypothetical protein
MLTKWTAHDFCPLVKSSGQNGLSMECFITHYGSVADRLVFFSDIFWCDRQTFFNVLWQSRAKTTDKTVTTDGNRQFFWLINETKNPEPTSNPLG